MNIRMATVNDAEQILDIYGPLCLTPVSFEMLPPSEDEMRQRIAHTLPHYPWLVCETEDRTLLGYVYASRHRERAAYQWSVDTAVYVREGQRGAGIGRALYTSLFRLLVVQGFYNAFAGITLPNPASIGLHQVMGFQRIGIYRGVGYKAGAWRDVAWWQLALQPRRAHPALPKTMDEAEATPEWQPALQSGAPLLRGRTE